jgi:hypothetical protein
MDFALGNSSEAAAWTISISGKSSFIINFRIRVNSAHISVKRLSHLYFNDAKYEKTGTTANGPKMAVQPIVNALMTLLLDETISRLKVKCQ